MSESSKHLKIKASAPTKNLPKIPVELEPKLKEVYSRYEHFIGINFVRFSPMEIEQDRQKYRHLLFSLRDGLPVFDQKACVEFMHLKSGIDYKYCAVQMYQEYIDLVASGFVRGEERENIDAEYYLTLSLIEKFTLEEK